MGSKLQLTRNFVYENTVRLYGRHPASKALLKNLLALL